MGGETWLWFSTALYGGSFLAAVGFLWRQRRYPQGLMVAVTALGLVVQTTGLYVRGLAQGHCPLGNPMEIVQFVVWSLVVMYLVVGPAFRVSLLGFFAVGLAGGLSLVSLLVPGWDRPYELTPFGITLIAELHAAMALFSYGVFGLLAATSMMYLAQAYALEKKARRTVFGFLPSVLELESINLRLAMLGVTLFSIAVLLGAWEWLFGALEVSWIKMLFAMVTWAAYAAALAFRWNRQLVAKRFAWVSLALFALALLTLWPVDASRV